MTEYRTMTESELAILVSNANTFTANIRVPLEKMGFTIVPDPIPVEPEENSVIQWLNEYGRMIAVGNGRGYWHIPGEQTGRKWSELVDHAHVPHNYEILVPRGY